MDSEIKALEKNGTCTITTRPQGKTIVGCKWIYKIKRHSNGTIERYKTRLVAKGYTQRARLDYFDNFSLVVKIATIRNVLCISPCKWWNLFQLDIDNAFLYGELEEEVFMALPQDNSSTSKDILVCKLHKSGGLQLHKSLYGLK